MSNRGSQHNQDAGHKGRSGPTRRRDADVDEEKDDAIEFFPGDVSEEIFWNVADSFIELANNQSDTVPAETVNAALMYAAARYSAFVAVNQHAQESDDAIEADTVAQYYSLQFRKLFDENLSQYVDTPATDELDGASVDDDEAGS